MKYQVTVPREVTQWTTFIVEADSPEDALDLVIDGEGDVVDCVDEDIRYEYNNAEVEEADDGDICT